MLADVDYICPSYKLCNPKHKKLAECEELIVRLRDDSKQRLSVAIHEAGHFLTAKKFGLQPKYQGPAIEHVRNTDEWICAFGRTCLLAADYQALTVEQMAEFLVGAE